MTNTNGKGNKGNGKAKKPGAVAAVAAAVMTAMVKTMDGIEVAVEKAFAFNHKAIVERRNALPRNSKLNAVLHQIVLTLEKEGPDSRTFESLESPKAKAYLAILEKIRVKGEVPILVPLTTAREDAKLYLTKKVDDAAARQAKLEADRTKEREDALKHVNEKLAKQAAKKEEEEAAAKLLGEIVSGDVVAEIDERQDERRAKKDLRDLHFGPITDLKSCVIIEEGTRGHVIALGYETAGGAWNELPLVDWVALEQKASELFKPLNLGDPAEMMAAMQKLEVDCPMCTDKMVIGDRRAQILQIPSFKDDWSDLWVHGRNHPKAGQPVEHRLLVCLDCAWHARNIASERTIKDRDGNPKSVKNARYAPAFEGYTRYCASQNARHYTGKTETLSHYDGDGNETSVERPVMVIGPSPGLKAPPRFNPADMAAAAAAVGKSDK